MKGTRLHGFSLVEVVIAIGIMAFAITAMIGLLSVAMQSDKSSGVDTAIAAMSQQVLGSLRAMPYVSLPASTNYYFDVEGSGCELSRAIYECVVALDGDPDLGTNKLKRVQMSFRWPGNTNVVQATIANYGY